MGTMSGFLMEEDGFPLCRALKNDEKRKDVPAL
jgi:hypothetical protein